STSRPSSGYRSREYRDAASQVRRLPRPAPPGRRAPDAAIPPRPRPGRASRPARLRRVLVRRAPFERLEMIASPEMFLAAAGERSRRIKLATGVISLPYHHPFNVAQRMVQLDHMSGGRVIFGSGPGALPSDAYMLGIDPMVQRDRQDEAIGVIKRLFAGERVTHESDWFTLKDARLQLFPLQEDMPFAVASQISPSGMTLAGKYGAGVLSIGSMTTQGLMAL